MMHAKHLCLMPQVRKEDLSSLRLLINHVSGHMNALQALSLNLTSQVLMFNQYILATLEPEIQWERERADIPTTAELVTILELRCRAIEILQKTQSLKVFPNKLCSSQSNGNKVTKTYSNVATQLQCSLCNESNWLFKGDKILNMQDRKSLNNAKKSGFISTACNNLKGITHVRSQCVVSVTRDIITCCT